MKKLIFILISLLLISCGDKLNNKNPDDNETVTVLPNHEIIYEINVRNFSPQGNFQGVTNDIPRLKELGVDILWLMPIHPIGEKNRVGSKGSPYSVKNYLEINPDYGTENDLQTLINTAHQNGMKVLLDWVANHTAWDNIWVSEHIDYYAANNGQRPYSPQDWRDVVQLDYSNNALRTAMISAMKYWVRKFDIDGFRCDYVNGVPVNFWQQAKTEIDAVKPLFWLAESDATQYMDVFNCDYAWGFSDKINAFGQNGNVTNLKNSCTQLFNNAAYTGKNKMVYITNHDINAYDGTEFERFNVNVFPLTVLMFTIYDMPLLYNGQEIGYNQRMGLFDINRITWNSVNQKMKTLVKKMIDLKRSQPCLGNDSERGSLTFYTTNQNSEILAYSRKRDNNEVLVILNFSGEAQNFTFAAAAPNGEFTDWLQDGKKTFNTETAVNIGANSYQVYVK
jgi:glycosidase